MWPVGGSCLQCRMSRGKCTATHSKINPRQNRFHIIINVEAFVMPLPCNAPLERVCAQVHSECPLPHSGSKMLPAPTNHPLAPFHCLRCACSEGAAQAQTLAAQVYSNANSVCPASCWNLGDTSHAYGNVGDCICGDVVLTNALEHVQDVLRAAQVRPGGCEAPVGGCEPVAIARVGDCVC